MSHSSMRSQQRWPNVQSRGYRGNMPQVERVLAYGNTCCGIWKYLLANFEDWTFDGKLTNLSEVPLP